MPRFRARPLSVAATAAAMAMAATGALSFTAQAQSVPSPAAGPKAEAKVNVLNWLAHKHSDTMPRSVGEGTEWTVYAHLYEHKKGKPGKKIGDATAHCSAVHATPQGIVTQCLRVLRTDGGSITLTDTIDRFGHGPHGGESAVTGGTGKYADAEGQAEIVAQGDYASLRISLDD